MTTNKLRLRWTFCFVPESTLFSFFEWKIEKQVICQNKQHRHRIFRFRHQCTEKKTNSRITIGVLFDLLRIFDIFTEEFYWHLNFTSEKKVRLPNLSTNVKILLLGILCSFVSFRFFHNRFFCCKCLKKKTRSANSCPHSSQINGPSRLTITTKMFKNENKLRIETNCEGNLLTLFFSRLNIRLEWPKFFQVMYFPMWLETVGGENSIANLANNIFFKMFRLVQC